MRAMISIALLLVLNFAISNAQTWLSLEGKSADPCHVNRVGALDCPANTERPESAVTVLLPSTTSTHPQIANLRAGNHILSVNGLNLPTVGVENHRYGLSAAGGSCAGAVTLPTNVNLGTATATQQSFNVPAAWIDVALELEAQSRRLCWSLDNGVTWRYTGLRIGVTWNCDPAAAAQTCAQLPITTQPYAGLTPQQQAVRAQRQTCCRRTTPGGLNVGQCINPLVQTCCGATAVERTQERCCSTATEITATFAGVCPCSRLQQNVCPSGESCCLASKYTELALDADVGQCYNVNNQRCCNTGQRYDPGTNQCCSINGIQSLNVPCPCALDADCVGGQVGSAPNTGFLCCKQSAPVLNPSDAERCTKYNNYPSGTGAFMEQQCWGNCFNPDYQICCNGVTCVSEYDRCCNSTCCNKFTGTCADAIHPGTPGNQHNWNEFDVHYDQCTHIEQLSALKAWWIYVLPTYLLALSLASLALVLVFANKVSSRSYNFVEKILIGLAVLIVIFGFPCFFAPVYKYGVVMVFVGLFTIIVAAARIKYLNVILVVVYLIALLYLFDPFNGNAYFNFASGRLPNGNVDLETAGILHATTKMWRNQRDPTGQWYCTNYYDYFNLDPALRDIDRYDNPQVQTFGYCARGWITALLIFEGMLLIFTLCNFIVASLALILRIKEDKGYDPIELEVRGQGAPVGDLIYVQ